MKNLPQRRRERRVNKLNFKGFLCALCAVAVFPFLANAEIYRWTDDKGVIHVTDDPSNVPANYWQSGRVKKEEVKPVPAESQPVQPALTLEQPVEEKAEMYGDQPLDWWKSKFEDLRKDISDNEEMLTREKNFVTVYEGSRGYGKIYSKEEISQYENYKKDISSLEEKLKNIKSELVELQRKATIYGVPRNIRE